MVHFSKYITLNRHLTTIVISTVMTNRRHSLINGKAQSDFHSVELKRNMHIHICGFHLSFWGRDYDMEYTIDTHIC